VACSAVLLPQILSQDCQVFSWAMRVRARRTPASVSMEVALTAMARDQARQVRALFVAGLGLHHLV
jgi:hypothetical protein